MRPDSPLSRLAFWRPRRSQSASSASLTEPKAKAFVALAGATGHEASAWSATEYRGGSVERVKSEYLEQDYVKDPVNFGGINAIASLTGSEGYTLEGKERDVEAVEEVFNNTQIEHWIWQVAQHLGIYGDHFSEIVPNKNGKIVHHLRVVDPKSMDFSKVRNSQGKVVYELDKNGLPKCYYQRPYQWDGNDLTAGIRLERDQIIHLRFREVADSLRGVGLLEPLHKVTWIKLNIEEALGEAIYRLGFPITIQECGDIEHDPGPEMITKAHESIGDIHNMDLITVPYYRKIRLLQGDLSTIRVNLDYYINQQIAALGVPKAVVTGLGEGTNRATLEELTDVGARNISTIHRAIQRALNGQLFPHMLELGQLRDEVKIQFNPIKPSEKMDVVNALSLLAQSGVITPDAALEDHVRKLLNIPARVGDFAPKRPGPDIAPDLSMRY